MTKRAWGATIQNREEKFEIKRRALLLSAARIIRRLGFEKMSLNDVALDLHVSKPTVYYYFRNKEEVVLELMEMAVSSLLNTDENDKDNPNAPGLTGAQRFERFLRRCVHTVNDDIGGSLFVVYSEQFADGMRRQLDAIGAPVTRLAEEILHGGVADGSIAPCDPMLVYHFAIAALRAIPLFQDRRNIPIDKVADSFADLILRGVAPRP